MSVTNWEFSGEEQLRSMRDGQEIVRPVMIEVNDPDDSLTTIKRDIPELQRWQRHPTELGFFVDEFSADRTTAVQQRDGRDHFYWAGSVRWIDTLDQKPQDMPPRLVNIRSETIQSATSKDWRGRAILNTAGDPVQPIPIVEQVRVFVFQKNVIGLPEELFDLENVVNSDAVTIKGQSRAPRTLLLRKVEFSDEQTAEDGDDKYRILVLELAYRKSTWVHKFPSAGFNQIVERRARPGDPQSIRVNTRGIDVVKEKVSITLDDGQRPSEQQLLDAEGRWIKNPQPEDMVLIDADVLPEASFAPILQFIAQ
jgi:hypothetical protein